MKLSKIELRVRPVDEISVCGRGLLFFTAPGGVRHAGIEATNGSISHGETLSGRKMDADSSH